MKQDAWGRRQRDLPIEYPTQTKFIFKHPEATPQEFEEWQRTELQWWAERQLGFVAMASLIQLSALGFMMLSFFLIGVFFVD